MSWWWIATRDTELAFFLTEAKNNLLDFCILTDKYFEVNNHHIIIAKELQDFMLWKTKRLILQLPPRSWKTRLTSEAIAWAFWNLENTDVIYTWHSIWLLESISRNIRNRISSEEYKYIFNARLEPWNTALKSWETTNKNNLMIYWVWWGITWKWWHRLIIDDPYASRQDVESETIRKTVDNWYDSTFYSRRHNEDSWICIIMQRWREDDLVWKVMSQENWKIVTIPAINDKWESFWASRFSVEELEKVRKQMWDYFFMSQYQQDPINEWSWTFQREYFEEYTQNDLLWKDLKIVTFIDPAISTKNTADYTAIVTVWLDMKSNNIYILDIFRKRVEPDELIDNLFSIVRKFNPETVWIETVQYQKMLALEIRKQMNIRNLYFYLEEVKPMWEKEARIKATLQPRYSNHHIFHKDQVEWHDLEAELLKFPNWKHDDIADATAWAISLLDSINYNWNWTSSVLVPDYSDLI